jgi:hypothetical protein
VFYGFKASETYIHQFFVCLDSTKAAVGPDALPAESDDSIKLSDDHGVRG